MSDTQNDQNKTAVTTNTKPAAKAKKPKGAGFAVFLALVAILLVAAASAYGWQQLQLLKQQMAQQDAPPIADQQLTTFKQNLAQRLDGFKDQQHVLERKLGNLENAVSAAASENTRDQRGWTLAEAQYLMNMANSRLRLLRDVNSAIEALKGADQRIASLNDPALFSVRELLAEEIGNLQAMGHMDSNGVALKLMSLSKLVQKLPPAKLMSSAATPSEETTEPNNELLAQVFNTIGLKKTNRPYMALPQQEDIFYLDQLMRLEIEAARHAVLRFDQKTYANHIQTANSLLAQHYDQENPQVSTVKEELQALAARNVFPALPDISASSVALNTARSRYVPAAPAETVVEAQEQSL